MLNKQTFVCPVCGYDGLREQPRDNTGSPSFEICPSCGTEYGYHDATRSHAELRREWLQAGAPWRHPETPPPPGWDPREQLKRANLIDQ